MGWSQLSLFEIIGVQTFRGNTLIVRLKLSFLTHSIVVLDSVFIYSLWCQRVTPSAPMFWLAVDEFLLVDECQQLRDNMDQRETKTPLHPFGRLASVVSWSLTPWPFGPFGSFLVCSLHTREIVFLSTCYLSKTLVFPTDIFPHIHGGPPRNVNGAERC